MTAVMTFALAVHRLPAQLMDVRSRRCSAAAALVFDS